MASERVTITLPEEMVQEIDGRERNRSRFVQQAVARELERLRQQELQRSLDNPHTPTARPWPSPASQNGPIWRLPATRSCSIHSAGKEIRWDADRGWIEADE